MSGSPTKTDDRTPTDDGLRPQVQTQQGDLKSDKAILFEVDNNVSAPVFTPENDGETDNADIFIRVNFNYETKEYGLEPVCQDG